MKLQIRVPLSFPDSWLIIFFLLLHPGVHAQQRGVADSIAYIIEHEKNPAKQCDALYQLGASFFNNGDIENALPAIHQAKSIAEKINYDKGIFDANSILGAISVREQNFDKAFSIAHQCLQLAAEKRSEYGSIKANYLLAFIYNWQGELDSVIAISKRTIERPHATYDSVNLPKFNTLLGNAYLGKGDYRGALTCYLDALKITESTNDERTQMACVANLALIYNYLKNYQEALNYQQRALVLAQKYNQAQALAKTYFNIGSIYRDLHKPDSALLFYRRALQGYAQFGLPLDIAITHNNLGPTFIDLNQPDSGLHYLQLAKTEFEQMRDSFEIMNNAMLLGTTWRMLGQKENNRSYFQLAQRELDLCQAIAERKKVEDLKMSCYYQQAVLYEAMGNESKAFWYLKRYNLISDSIRSEQYTHQIAEMQTQYEKEKKETEISKLTAEKLLSAEQLARQQTFNYSLLAMAGLILVSGSIVFRNVQKKRVAEKQIAILEKQNAIESMRSKIASDVHDEMGANLTRLGLNAQQLMQSTVVPQDEKVLAEKMAAQSQEILTGMREIIWASNPANDNLKSMLGFMRQYIDRFFDGTQIRPVVNFPQNIGEVTLHPEVRRNLFLILKESLNNALKYSGSDRIDIDFKNENENFQLKVKDYGKGLDHDYKDDFSNGLSNMQMRAQQIRSLFRLITAPGQGVQISVEGKLY
jgi:signal transduction histidine kinase